MFFYDRSLLCFHCLSCHFEHTFFLIELGKLSSLVLAFEKHGPAVSAMFCIYTGNMVAVLWLFKGLQFLLGYGNTTMLSICKGQIPY